MIHPTAVIENSKIDPTAHIGPFCHIANTVIGRRVKIYACCTIGTEGMQFDRRPDGSLEDCYPHHAQVVIKDDVWIGGNCDIQRGKHNDTIIEEGTKIGSLSSVGHESVIGKHCLIINRCVISGHVTIGDYARISVGACVRDRVSIGSRAHVGMGAVVTKDVKEGTTVWGVPAREQT